MSKEPENGRRFVPWSALVALGGVVTVLGASSIGIAWSANEKEHTMLSTLIQQNNQRILQNSERITSAENISTEQTVTLRHMTNELVTLRADVKEMVKKLDELREHK